MFKRSNMPHREVSSPLIGGALLTFLFLFAVGSAGPWHLRMGFIALALGGLMIFAPPVIRLRKPLILLACGYLIFSLASFLPVEFFTVPSWRIKLNELGVVTGDLVVIQWKSALESHLSFVLLFLSGLWILGQRFTAEATRKLVLAFILGVAAYAIISMFLQDAGVTNAERFGFFPNRNHSSNLLSLGFISGLGLIFQSLRSKRYYSLGAALVITGVILWAILFWNVSRSGIFLCLFGAILWVLLLGWRYFGRQEIKAFGLAALLIGGVYLIAEFQVKDRITDTVDKITADNSASSSASLLDAAPEKEFQLKDVDLRVPIALDTLQMIKDAPLTGVGAGQFRWVFPQYREETLVSPNTTALHPENSWLWLAAEFGIPAATCILIMVAFLFLQGKANIKQKGNRDRALRLACLVAAVLVPFHSLFDVSAHRPTLLLAALFLFAIAQNPEKEQLETKRPLRWPSIVLAGLLITAGLRLLGSSWFGWTLPYLENSKEQLAKGSSLYEQVSDLKNPLPPFASLAMREEVSSLAEIALKDAPLDGRLYRLSALATLPLEYESGKTAQYFEVDRYLSPSSIQIPLIHSSSALFYNHDEVEKGWLAALERAQNSDQVSGEKSQETKRALRVITASAARNSQLENLANQIEKSVK